MKIYRHLLILIILFLTLTLVKEGNVGQIVEEEVTLEEIIEKSDYIVIAKELDPPYTVEEISIHSDRNKYPPFEKYIYTYEQVKALYKNDDEFNKYPDFKKLTQCKDMKVLTHDYKEALGLHKLYYLKGISKSPYMYSYKQIGKKGRSNEIILFLKYNISEKSLEFTVSNSYEFISKKRLVVKRIKKYLKKKEKKK